MYHPMILHEIAVISAKLCHFISLKGLAYRLKECKTTYVGEVTGHEQSVAVTITLLFLSWLNWSNGIF